VRRNVKHAEAVFQQKELGTPAYMCELGGIDFAQVAQACEPESSRWTEPRQLRAPLASTLGPDPPNRTPTPEQLMV
jgi:pyruvate dehydrogenase (quinone)/pyruvate decarboxylase